MLNPKLDDTFIYKPTKKYITPFFCKHNIHPNYVTIFCMLLNILLYYKLKNYYNLNNKNDRIFIIVLLFVMCFLDCLDGSVARNCNKYSELGGFLDITCDNIRWAILFSYFLLKYFKCNVFNFYFIYFIFFVFFILEKLCSFDFASHEAELDIFNLPRDNSIFGYILLAIFI